MCPQCPDNDSCIYLLGRQKRELLDEILKTLDLPNDHVPSSSKYLELKQDFEGDSDALRNAIFRDACYFCGIKRGEDEEKKVPIHRKDGRPHQNRLIRREKYYRTLNPDEWVSLCSKHHRYVHWAMNTFDFNWDDLEFR